jgi:hypothetical protein
VLIFFIIKILRRENLLMMHFRTGEVYSEELYKKNSSCEKEEK